MRPLVLHALVWGLALSVVLSALILGILRANPEIMLSDYPPDIRAAWGPMTPRTKRQRPIAAGLLLVAVLAVVVVSLRTLPAGTMHRLTFAPAFLYFATMFGVFNVFDWLVLDCGLVVFQPPFAILPGTAGLPGYRDHRFHFRGFLLGILVVLVGSAIVASVITIVL